MPTATPPEGPARVDAPNRPVGYLGDGRDPALDGVVGILARSLETQTAAIREGMTELGVRLDGAVTDLRAEARSTRNWFVGAIVLAIIVLGGAAGVKTALDVPGVGSVDGGPAQSAPPASVATTSDGP